MANMIEIEITCYACSSNNVIIEEKLDPIIRCQNCEEILLKIQEIKGFIYVLSNPSMPGLFKIGYTEREIEDRIKELNSETGVPEPFVLDAYCVSQNPRGDESRIHQSLSTYRMESKEFFKVDFDTVIEIIEKTLEKTPKLSKERMRDREEIKGLKEIEEEVRRQKEKEEEGRRQKEKEKEGRRQREEVRRIEETEVRKQKEIEELFEEDFDIEKYFEPITEVRKQKEIEEEEEMGAGISDEEMGAEFSDEEIFALFGEGEDEKPKEVRRQKEHAFNKNVMFVIVIMFIVLLWILLG